MQLLILLSIFTINLNSKPTKGMSWTRHERVKYVDINLAMRIQKEVFYDFDISKLHTTETGIFEVKKITPKEEKTLSHGTKLVFEPKAKGKTDLWVYDENEILRFVHAVNVTDANYKRIYSYIKHELRNVEGLEIKWWEDNIILDGEILLPEDIARIHQVITMFPKSVFKVMYKMSPMLFKIIAKKMEIELGNPNIHVTVVNNKFVVTGFVHSTEELEEIRDKLVLYLPKYYYTPNVGAPSGGSLQQPSVGADIISWLVKIIEKDEPSYLIKVSVFFVEVNKSFDKNFGFYWSPSLDTAGTQAKFGWESGGASATTAALTGIVSSFIPKLSSMIENRKGRVIQSIATTVNEGKSAKINKMTKIPYVIPGPAGGTSSVSSSQVGLAMDITPSIIGADKAVSRNIRLETSINVSQLVSKTSTGLPIVTQNTINTTIDIKSEQAAAIGGVIQSNSNRTYGNSPAEGVTNVIINLSRSKDFQRSKTRFLIFILPKILKDATEGSRKILKKFRMD